jgi:hypothetical protein
MDVQGVRVHLHAIAGGVPVRSIEHYPPSVQNRIRAAIEAEDRDRAARNTARYPTETLAGQPSDLPEAELQTEVEAYLMRRGYLRLTASNVDRVLADPRISIRGFFGHWTDNERNPLISDHLILSGDMRRCLLIEYKSKKHKWEAGQRELCDMGLWRLAMDAEAAKELVTTWEVT